MQLFEPKVKLNEADHTYSDADGNNYLSFSKFLNTFLVDPFKADFIAGQVAKSGEQSKQEVLDGWQQRTDLGTYYDKVLQECVDPINYEKYPDIADQVRSILGEYSGYRKSYEQLVLYNSHYRVAGSCDKLCIKTTASAGLYTIVDFKCYEKPEDLFLSRGWLKEPLDHLPNTKYSKICLQLSFYSFLFEQLTGRKCAALWIHVIDSVNKKHHKVHVPYLRSDIFMLLETFRDKILYLVEKQESIF